MAVVLTVENGSGVTAANSYVSLADATTYFETRAPAAASTPWLGADTDDIRKGALISATRFGDAYVQTRLGGYRGTRVKSSQALAWPRAYCPDPDPINLGLDPGYVGSIDSAQYLPSSAVPLQVVYFTCELTLMLLGDDLVAVRGGEGLSSVSAGSAGVSVTFATAFAAFSKTVSPYAVDVVRALTMAGATHGASTIRRVA